MVLDATTPDPVDFLAVCDLRYRYATGIDTRDWPLHRSIYTDEIEMDFSSYNGAPARRLAADAWVEGLKPLFHGLAATQHSMTNPRVTVEGDSATLVMYMQAEHVLDHEDQDAVFTLGGYYSDLVVRTAAGWRISAVTLTVFWRRGRPDIMATALERGRRLLGEGAR